MKEKGLNENAEMTIAVVAVFLPSSCTSVCVCGVVVVLSLLCCHCRDVFVVVVMLFCCYGDIVVQHYIQKHKREFNSLWATW